MNGDWFRLTTRSLDAERSSTSSARFRPRKNGWPTSPTRKPGAPTRTMCVSSSLMPGCETMRSYARSSRSHIIAWRKDMEQRAAVAVHHPPQALGAVVAFRLSLRTQRGRSAIPSTASSGRWPTAMKAARRRSVTARRASCWRRRRRTRSRAFAIGPSWRPCSITAYAAKSSAACA